MKNWKNKKFKNKFKGKYVRDKFGERNFVLIERSPSPHKSRRITFESWQAAKKLGWS